MDIISITAELLNILKQLPFESKRKVAIDLLEKFLRHLNGENTSAPTKEEFKIAIDSIKELKQQWTLSTQEYNEIEAQAEYIKQLIDWGYKG